MYRVRNMAATRCASSCRKWAPTPSAAWIWKQLTPEPWVPGEFLLHLQPKIELPSQRTGGSPGAGGALAEPQIGWFIPIGSGGRRNQPHPTAG